MIWSGPPPKRGDVMAALMLAGLAVVLGLGWFLNWGKGDLTNNFGFGPEWDCKNVANSEPVCIKKR